MKLDDCIKRHSELIGMEVPDEPSEDIECEKRMGRFGSWINYCMEFSASLLKEEV